MGTAAPSTVGPSTGGTVVRALAAADLDAAEEVGFTALEEAGRRYGFSMGVRDDARIRFARSRVAHLASTDPAGALVAERGGEIVGVALALRRGSLWFLSLLAVRTDQQAGGIGRRLLDAALTTATDAERAMICASPDPKALRRYRRAGFDLHATLESNGVPDRSALPAGLGVREGELDRDRAFVEELITARRGEPYGPDLTFGAEQGGRLLLVDGPTPEQRAVACLRGSMVGPVAATSEDAARQVLLAAVAEAGAAGEDAAVRLGYLTAGQQWAVDVALDAGLPVSPAGALCTRGYADAPRPYLPSGIFG
jgi:predicted N-acetyltransferase YhbS